MNQAADYDFIKYIFDSPQTAGAALAKEMIEKTRISIQENGNCVWALSGGSTIHKLYAALQDFKTELKNFSTNLVVIWVDERVVPHTDKNSNFGNAYKDFWNQFDSIRLIPVPYNRDAEQAVQEYENLLDKNKIGFGDVDITVLGMGTDGHTASLFPGNKALKEENDKAVNVSDPSVKQSRVSLTYPFINGSKLIYLFFYGEEKARTFQQAQISGDANSYPILGIDRSKMEIYVDEYLK